MSSRADTREVFLAVPARAEFVGLLRLALSAIARLTGLSGAEVAELKLAVDEAASRWVPAATETLSAEPRDESATAPRERLSVRYGLGTESLELDVRCPGPEVMPLSERELSLAILGATADECHAETGRIRLVKYLKGEAPG